MTGAAAALVHPLDGEGVTAGYLNQLLATSGSQVRVERVAVMESRTYGTQMVSTAGRVLLDVVYREGSPEHLPTRLVLKIARGDDNFLSPFYRNEVNFYRRLRPEIDVEAPFALAADFDESSQFFGVLMENLAARGATFPNVMDEVSLEHIQALLATLARLHARYWNSPRFHGDLAWIQTHVAGDLVSLHNVSAPAHIQHEVDTQKFKRELVGKLGWSPSELLAGLIALQKHQATLAQCLLHADSHLGNTYALPDGRVGLLDWQLMVRGYPMHDVSYIIATSQSIARRRLLEQDLLRYYLDRLAEEGVTDAPGFEETWLEYRRAMLWTVYVGWLTTPVMNYGWEINVLNHLRVTTAFDDLGTGKIVRAVM